ncbi:MAG: hypothetical protein HOV79_00490 [Hamadaea sp.]|nr:hypothetical protein [Hamadaea sp.]
MAQHLETGGAGSWDPTGADYPDDVVAITLRDILPGPPDRLITLADYPVVDVPGVADVTQGVQLRFRGTTDPQVCTDIADACYELLHGLGRVSVGGPITWGVVQVVQVYRQSYTSLGRDDNGRWEQSHNYYVEAMRPNTNNPD